MKESENSPFLFPYKTHMTLYVFITHKANLDRCRTRISEMMKSKYSDESDYVIVTGGALRDHYDEESRTIHLNCNDKYVGLPEKVMKTFNFLISDERFGRYSHFAKLDDDMIVDRRLEVLDGDYIGNVHHVDGNRQWHVGRCGNFWDRIPYIGDFKPWCMGGYGYVVSREALEKITPNHDYLDHIYEDVYIGLLMHGAGIIPVQIDITRYLKSPDHR